jgi:hypothetical protein
MLKYNIQDTSGDQGVDCQTLSKLGETIMSGNPMGGTFEHGYDSSVSIINS